MAEITEEKNKKQKKHRITFQIDRDLHTEIKARAAYKNITLKQWIRSALLALIKYEKQYE